MSGTPASHFRWLWLSRTTRADDAEALASGASLKPIKRDEGDLVLLGPEIVIKFRALKTLADRLRTRFGAGRLRRQVRGALQLAQANIPTATPIACGTCLLDGKPTEVLLLERIEGNSVLRTIADQSTPITEEHALADALGAMIAALLMAGLANRDGKPSNLIAQQISPSTAGYSADPRNTRIVLLDTVGIEPIIPRHRFLEACTLMLASLLIEPTGCGVPPRRTLCRRVLRATNSELWRLQGTAGSSITGKPSKHPAATADPNPTANPNPEPDPDATPDQDSDPAADHVDELWEIKSSRAMWKLVATHITKHGDPRPKINPLAN